MSPDSIFNPRNVCVKERQTFTHHFIIYYTVQYSDCTGVPVHHSLKSYKYNHRYLYFTSTHFLMNTIVSIIKVLSINLPSHHTLRTSVLLLLLFVIKKELGSRFVNCAVYNKYSTQLDSELARSIAAQQTGCVTRG